MAIGYEAKATNRNSTAIGYQARTFHNNQVAIGNKHDRYIMPGLASSKNGKQFWANTTFQNGGEKRFVSTDSDGNLGTTSFSVEDLRRSIQGVAASTAALASLPQSTLLPDETIRCGFGTGVYGSQGAGAFGCAAKANERLFFNIGGALSAGPYFNGSVAAKFGVSYGFGGSSANQGVKDKAEIDETNAELKKLREEINELKIRIKQDVDAQSGSGQPIKISAYLRDLQTEIETKKKAEQQLIERIQKQGQQIAKQDKELKETRLNLEQAHDELKEQRLILKSQQAQINLLLRQFNATIPETKEKELSAVALP